MKDVLFASALAEESAQIAAHAPVLHMGAGKVQAAVAVAHHLAANPGVELVVNVGTAGALGGYALGDVAEVAVVAQHDFDHVAVSALAGRPLPGGPLTLEGPTGATARLATGDRFVADPDERAALAASADLVDMEGYAVAATCRSFGVPVWITKCVSDTADADAAISWGAALEMTAERLAGWARQAGLLG